MCGFVAVAEDTGALYREFLLRDGVSAAVAAVAGIARGAACRVGDRCATACAEDRQRGRARRSWRRPWRRTARSGGSATALVQAAVEELRRRGVASARVVTAVGNLAAVKAYERGGFRVVGLEEVHRGVAQQLLVWP